MRAAVFATGLIAWLGTIFGPSACTCSPPGDPKQEPSGLLGDVRSACEHRVAWPHRLRTKCTKCMSLASTPKCGCPTDDKEYSGLCARERSAQVAAKECVPVWSCTYKCKPTDCACFAQCYEGQAACHEIASAIDGCLVEVCDPFCRGDAK